MSLPDLATSRAVLIGVASYVNLEPLPSVAAGVRHLAALLQDPEVLGLAADHCRLVLDPATGDEVLTAVHQAAAEASDTLLVYYAGHGMIDPDSSDLYLAMPAASQDRLFKALRYDDVRRVVTRAGRCRAKVVILDCCYSGLAMTGWMSGATDLADRVQIEGSCLLTAAAETVLALAPPHEEYTAFTGELVRVLKDGVPNGSDLLDVDTMYWQIRNELAAKGRPLPQQRSRNNGANIIIARNRQTKTAALDQGPRQSLLPEPPDAAQAERDDRDEDRTGLAHAHPSQPSHQPDLLTTSQTVGSRPPSSVATDTSSTAAEGQRSWMAGFDEELVRQREAKLRADHAAEQAADAEAARRAAICRVSSVRARDLLADLTTAISKLQASAPAADRYYSKRGYGGAAQLGIDGGVAPNTRRGVFGGQRVRYWVVNQLIRVPRTGAAKAVEPQQHPAFGQPISLQAFAEKGHWWWAETGSANTVIREGDAALVFSEAIGRIARYLAEIE